MFRNNTVKGGIAVPLTKTCGAVSELTIPTPTRETICHMLSRERTWQTDVCVDATWD